MKLFRSLLFVIFVVLLTVNLGEGKSKKKTKQLALQAKETNVVNFVRLLLMRLGFGIASSMGLGENVSEFLGGALVPPGAEDYNAFDADDDYDGGFL